jgi:hypothetical protein
VKRLRASYRFALCAILLLCFTSVPSARNLPPPAGHYQSVFDSISKARGQIQLDMRGGIWRIRAQGKSVFWRVDDGTTISINFDYGGGVLQSASMEFSPAVHVDVQAPPGISLTINKVSYRGDESDISGQMMATILGMWESGDKPLVTAKSPHFDMASGGGPLVLNPRTRLRLAGGKADGQRDILQYNFTLPVQADAARIVTMCR